MGDGSLKNPNQALLWLLLLVAVCCRVGLQVLTAPPYAGLDEIFHVARLVFTDQEHRSPNRTEPSIPGYLQKSIQGDPLCPPVFALQAAKLPPEALFRRSWPDPTLEPRDLHYEWPNYQAQHPGLYYRLAAPLRGALSPRTALRELLCWRALSAAFAVICAVAVAWIGFRLGKYRGLLVAILLVSSPTWISLTVRASNDALACALIAVAIAVSLRERFSASWVLVETLCWAGALATKLYAWPVLIVIPLFAYLWPGWERRLLRLGFVALGCAASVILTVADLRARTGHYVGLQEFTTNSPRPGFSVASLAAIDWFECAKVFVFSAAWMPGQHGNALRPLGLLIYALPVLILVTVGVVSAIRATPVARRHFVIAGATIAAFMLAQAVHFYGFARDAV